MPDNEVSRVPPPTNEDLRNASRQFDYANRAAAGDGHDVAIQCLRTCCKLVPTNLSYRQALRKVEKAKYNNNLHGSLLAPLTTFFRRLRLWRAMKREDHLRVLEHGEAILAQNPWDRGAQLGMASSADALGQPILAVWILQQAREKNAQDVRLNRALARLLEKQGLFNQAIQLWEMVRRKAPQDTEAQNKAKQLAASETIARGSYEKVAAAEAAEQAEKAQAAAGQTVRKNPFGVEEETPAVEEEAEVGPDHYLELAAGHWCDGRFEEARAVLEQGVAAVGPVFELTLALSELEIEPMRRSLIRTEEQLARKPQDDKLQKSRGELVARINARELACYRKRAEHDPTDASSRFELGVRLLRANQIDDAICELEAARADAGLQWKALLHLGHCFLARRNWPLARRNFEEALRHLPGDEEAVRKELKYYLAVGHADAGDLPRAVQAAREVIKEDPDYRDIGRRLAEWQGRSAGRPSVKPTGK